MTLKDSFYDFLVSDIQTSSTTAVDVPQMTFPLRAADGVYQFRFVLKIGSSSAAGLKIAITVTGGAVFQAWAVGSAGALSTLQVDQMNQSGVLGAAFATVALSNLFLTVEGGIRNGNFAGALQLQAAKVTSGTATLHAGSYFTAQQL